MSRYINIEPIEKEIERELTIGQIKIFSEHEKGVLNVYDAIKKTPTADVEEVVRCKDCKYCDKEDEHEYWCNGRGFPSQLTTPDDYCSKGRKKRGNENDDNKM